MPPTRVVSCGKMESEFPARHGVQGAVWTEKSTVGTDPKMQGLPMDPLAKGGEPL